MVTSVMKTRSMYADAAAAFLALSAAALKGVWDAYYLAQIDGELLLAFALVFPLTILVNCCAAGVASGVIATFGNWPWLVGNGICRTAVLVVTASAVVAGTLSGVTFWFAGPFVAGGLNAGIHSSHVVTFCAWTALWLPLQMTSHAWLSIARGAGLQKQAAAVIVVCSIAGMMLSMLLLSEPGVDPMRAVVLSNAAIAGVSCLALLRVVLRARPILATSTRGASTLLRTIRRVGSAALAANAFGLAFVTVVTLRVKALGDDVAAAFAYIARFEQLALSLSAALIVAALPYVAQALRAGDVPLARETAARCCRHLVGLGVVSVVICYLAMEAGAAGPLVGDRDTELLIASMLVPWLVGSTLQGVGLLKMQVVGTFLRPGVSAMVNAVRFLVVGIPLVLFAERLFGLAGLVYAMPVAHAVSLLVARFVYAGSWDQRV